ncbi:NUDIX hydrolase [Nocardia testacea]|uniref:NUDIX hydrolase n=1 Tax=Nocardia testacea TaxID=248551 RepID=UPI0033C47224
MSFRLAAYAVCVEGGRVLLLRHVSPKGGTNWTLPGGRVEHAEDPFDTVIREFAEETGCAAVVERLLGVDSRVIPAAERTVPGGPDHQNVGIFYEVGIVRGRPRPEPNGETVDPTWTPLGEVASRYRSSLVDIGLALFLTRPATGHVAPVPVTGPVRH